MNAAVNPYTHIGQAKEIYRKRKKTQKRWFWKNNIRIKLTQIARVKLQHKNKAPIQKAAQKHNSSRIYQLDIYSKLLIITQST